MPFAEAIAARRREEKFDLKQASKSSVFTSGGETGCAMACWTMRWDAMSPLPYGSARGAAFIEHYDAGLDSLS